MVNLKINTESSPLVTVSIHNGHEVRPELLPYLNLSESERLREEDPFTSEWVKISDNRIEMMTSRFEVDVNRPPFKCIYRSPEDSWKNKVWNEDLPDEVVDRSLQVYRDFYTKVEEYFNTLFKHHSRIVVYDLHSYNYRRDGVDKYGLPEENPEINIGTQNMNRYYWDRVISRLITTMREFNYEGRHLDVRENIKFKGGFFTQWLYEKYGDRICPIAIEIKKIFMNEWTGEPDYDQIRHMRELLIASIRPVTQEVENLKLINDKLKNRDVTYQFNK